MTVQKTVRRAVIVWHLSFSCGVASVGDMSTKAEAVLEQIRALSPEDQREVMESWRQPAGSRVTDRRQRLRQGRGLLAGSGLLEALLADRAKERARG